MGRGEVYNASVVLSSKESERGAREVGERGQDEIELEAVDDSHPDYSHSDDSQSDVGMDVDASAVSDDDYSRVVIVSRVDMNLGGV